MTASSEEFEYLTKSRALTIEQQQQDEKPRAAQIKQLEGNVTQLNRNLSVTRKNLENLVVPAPVDGLLSLKLIWLLKAQRRKKCAVVKRCK
jgi:HlyD family secretion protein